MGVRLCRLPEAIGDSPHGFIPKGRLAEDGIVPEEFDQMEVAPRKDYLYRTEWNVTHSDATLIITLGAAGRALAKPRLRKSAVKILQAMTR